MNPESAEKQFEFEMQDCDQQNKQLSSLLMNDSPKSIKKDAQEKRIVLSDRDYEILEFILEMKFASLDEVCAKFFKGSPANRNVVGYWYAKKRLAQLEQAGFLESTRRHSESRRLYFSKLKSYFALKNLLLDKNLPRPTESIDSRTVAHDYLLLKMRLELEKRYVAHSWISDRSLRVQTGILAKLEDAYTPDGIYKPIQGAPVAFELEIALKSKARYHDKVKRYVQWIREHRNDPTAFKKVHFVTTNEAVKKHLDHFTAIYSEIFKIEMASVYFTESVGLK